MTVDREAEFIEDVGVLLSEMGLPRMGAKAFAALLVAPGEGLTARELSERVSASPAAISGAMRLLTQFKMVRRSRRRGERADRYTIGENVWEEAMLSEIQTYKPMITTIERARDDLELTPEAHERMTETLDFLRFFVEEMPRMMSRWNASRR